MPPRDPLPMTVTPLASFPPMAQWDDWMEYDSAAWPKKVERRYTLVPTTCFNCEAACGLVAYVDKTTWKIQKLEGNPHHPGSRGRNCAKGPATKNQIEDPQRILYPLKRSGPRGSGKYERTTWDEVLDVFAAKIRKALIEDRRTEIMYHVGRPGHDGYMDRVLQSWGVDGHNSHTNVCSGAARLGYALWTGADRPSPDHENSRMMLLLSSHLETGHYFNPHAQRIIDAKMKGAKLAVVDVRLSNTASMADWWLAPYPGTEALMLLAFAHVILEEKLFDRAFVEQWVNWREFLTHVAPQAPSSFEEFLAALRRQYAHATPEAAALECGLDATVIREVARAIGAAGSAFASHVWRNAASGNEGGWQVARCLEFLCVLVGSVASKGGTNLNTSDKFVPPPFLKPPPQNVWNELLYPKEWPLSHHELSFLLPHFLKEGRGKIAAYFTRVYNPVWTNPDGMMWEEVLRDESKIELHAALTPTWSETAQYADYVLPMGLGAERHDLMSQETHAAKWISFRQPVLRVAKERAGEKQELTRDSNPGEVWEEDEFWIALSWRIDPDGSLGVRKYYESPYRPGQRITVDEYYAWIFENSVPGLPAEAKKHGLTPLEYMRRYGAFLVEKDTYQSYLKTLSSKDLEGATTNSEGTVLKAGAAIGVVAQGAARTGFATPSRKLELWSQTMADWGWSEYALPGYIESHVHRKHMDVDKGEYPLVPTFRLPTLIHTRSGNSKWLYELSNTNPVWIHPTDAARIGVDTGDLVRVATRIGHYVNKVWVTEGMRPGVVACSHHLGRWRLFDSMGSEWATFKAVREDQGGGKYRFRRIEDIRPFESSDPDSKRVWWTDGGVHQNLTFPVQPDPVSGMHCWHQRVSVTRALAEDQYGDVCVDTKKSMEVYREWLAKARPAVGPLRRPLHFARAVRPTAAAYRMTT
ncbi:MAG TPA: molybdopterin dinucleotide binding domain-containing protein [Planctomycetota bacterium]|nr:molybdopterin dinucleotide binding domain-containing protein [Planctomycetota bacterium]